MLVGARTRRAVAADAARGGGVIQSKRSVYEPEAYGLLGGRCLSIATVLQKWGGSVRHVEKIL